MNWFGTNSVHQNGYSSPGPVPGPARGILARLRQISAGWLGPRLSQGTSVAQRLRDERLASGPRGIFDLPWFLPYYDNYTQETPAMRLAYRMMWADPNVKAACSGKIFSVAALDLKFQPSDKKDADSRKHAEWCDYLFNERLRGGLPELAWSILSGACTDGYSVNEKVWGSDEQGRWKGLWGIHALKAKDTLNDLALQTDEFRNVTGILGLRYNAGREFAPADFVIYRHMPLYDQPVGMSDFRAAYSRYWMLDTSLKLRAIGLEKRSYPLLIGHWRQPTEQSALEKALAAAKWQNWVSAPEHAQIEAVNLAGSGDQIFAAAIKDLKHDIFLAIRGAVLQALEGSLGVERGNSEVHKETSELLDWYLAAQLMRVFNDRDTGLIRDVIDPNFIAHEYPKATISAVDLAEMEAESRIDTTLHTFLPLSKEEAYERYNRTPPTSPEDTIAPATGQAPGGPGAGGMPGMGSGDASPFADISGLTDRAKLLAGEVEDPARTPFRFAEEWCSYLR